MWTSLRVAKNIFIQAEESNKKLSGYIHYIAMEPLVIHLWTERQIRLWHDLCKRECCYLDATGTIIANWYGRRVLYYPLVMRHPVQGIPPIPVAELITSIKFT